MPEQFGDKTHDATPYRRQKAREEGQLARSHDLVSAVTLLGAVLGMMFLGSTLLGFLFDISQRSFGADIAQRLDGGAAADLLRRIAYGLGLALGPLLALVMTLAIAANVLQTGFLFLPEKLAFDWSRVDPLKGVQRLFSLSSVMRLAMGVGKIAVLACLAGWIIVDAWEAVIDLAATDVSAIAAFLLDLLLWMSLKLAAALFVLALLDFLFQWWKHEQDLKMTHQEIREEMKQLQGDPQTIARRRQVQRQLAMSRLGGKVPQADVVVTNPTELAVALKYEFETMAAPVVVAKGAGVLAQRIRRLALEHNVPIVERKPLAQALYRDVEVGHPIPTEQYAAVAEVLRYVYELKGKPLPGQQAA